MATIKNIVLDFGHGGIDKNGNYIVIIFNPRILVSQFGLRPPVEDEHNKLQVQEGFFEELYIHSTLYVLTEGPYPLNAPLYRKYIVEIPGYLEV